MYIKKNFLIALTLVSLCTPACKAETSCIKSLACMIPFFALSACATDDNQTRLAAANFGVGFLTYAIPGHAFSLEKKGKNIVHAFITAANIGAGIYTRKSYKNKTDFIRNPLIHTGCYFLGRLAMSYMLKPKNYLKKLEQETD